jgi:anti-sigma factor RsiW
MNHIADNHDALLDYLYEEGEPAERLKIAKHLQECAACSVAVLEFQSVRGMLRGWTPPSADLGFRIVQDAPGLVPPPVKPAPSAYRYMLQAAAAVVLFAAGLAVSQIRVDYRDGVVMFRTSAAVPSATVRSSSITLPPQNVDVDALVEQVRARLGAGNAPSIDTEQLLQRVRAMIDQSEQRQQRELALRLSQVASEVETQHQADLLRIQQSFGQTQEMMDYLVRTSGGAK